MKCRYCGEEIVMAEICPYCGQRNERQETGGQKAQQRPERTFRGTIPAGGRGGAKRPVGGGFLPTLVGYFRDPKVSPWRKGVFVLGLFYLISPLDFLPDFFVGPGWLDDMALIAILWRFLTAELERYRAKNRS